MLVEETEKALKDLMKYDTVELLQKRGKADAWFVCYKNKERIIIRISFYKKDNKKTVRIGELMTLENGKTIWYPRKSWFNV